jgi:tetratricopeptide (TPR) repeat protein
MLGGLAANAFSDKKLSAQSIKNLKSRPMSEVSHNRSNPAEGLKMHRIIAFIALLAIGTPAGVALAQGYPGGGGPMGQSPMGGGVGRQPHEEQIPSTPMVEKPDKAATKAYAAGMKALDKARELEDVIAKSTDAGKKAKAEDKLGDAYGTALDRFTEVLRNKSDMYDAWNEVGFVHLRLGAYRESIDDYNHALTFKPDLPVAVANRAVAYLMTDRLEDAKSAYMDLFFHERPLADDLMVHMQDWVQRHRTAANGVRPADIDSFDKWVTERSGIAKTAAAGAN